MSFNPNDYSDAIDREEAYADAEWDKLYSLTYFELQNLNQETYPFANKELLSAWVTNILELKKEDL